MFTVSILPYERRHRQLIRNLLFNASRVHTQLDWDDILEWLDRDDSVILLAWAGDQFAGVMGISAPLNSASWLRLAAIHNDFHPDAIFPHLWAALRPMLSAVGAAQVAVLMVRDWLAPTLDLLGFQQIDEIVTLRRATSALPELPTYAAEIRAYEGQELERLAQIDHAAFRPPWQLSVGDLRRAHRVAAVFTVAILQGRIVGYQASTMYFDGGHLARLAVDPAVQGLGIGRALLDDVLRRFMRRGVNAMTLNTQLSNEISQRLYAQFEFLRNGFDLPVLMASV